MEVSFNSWGHLNSQSSFRNRGTFSFLKCPAHGYKEKCHHWESPRAVFSVFAPALCMALLLKAPLEVTGDNIANMFPTRQNTAVRVSGQMVGFSWAGEKHMLELHQPSCLLQLKNCMLFPKSMEFRDVKSRVHFLQVQGILVVSTQTLVSFLLTTKKEQWQEKNTLLTITKQLQL